MRDLLQGLGLENRLIKDNNYNLDELIKKIRYTKVKQILNKKIEFSKSYLEEILSIKR